MDNKTRILFVDDDATVLSGLRRMLYKMSSLWKMDFTSDGDVALEMMRERPYDILVSDIRMPGIDGVRLLERVQEEYPQTIRFVLSGQSDSRKLVQTIGLAHQFLAKPCDADTLKRAIQRAEQLRTLLTNPLLQRLIASMKGLPVMPAVLVELMEALESPDRSLRQMGELISRDVGLTAKVLQVVNSPLFGLRQQITDPQQAVVLLGLDMVNALILAMSALDAFKGNATTAHTNALYSHAVRVGQCARYIAKELGDAGAVERALVSGILHDVGKLILLAQVPDAVQQAQEMVEAQDIPLCQAEQDVLGVSHAEVGAYLLGLWGFDEQIVTAVACHHQAPQTANGTTVGLQTIIYIANVLDRAWFSPKPDGEKDVVKFPDLERLGVTEQQLATWRSRILMLKDRR